MARLIDDKADLFIPDEALRTPAAAAADPSGLVACVGCGQQIALASADIVGNGYRCAPCGQRAHIAALESGRADPGAHLTDRERDKMYASGSLKLVAGGVLLVFGAILFAVGMTRTSLCFGAAGLGSMVVGAVRRSDAR